MLKKFLLSKNEKKYVKMKKKLLQFNVPLITIILAIIIMLKKRGFYF